MSPTDPLDGLRNLLRSCTAFVSGATRGTAFFIDTDLLLTVAHVAGKEGDTVTVVPYGGKAREAKVEKAVKVAEGDLALIRLTPVASAGFAPSPAVLLGRAGSEARSFLTTGYPTIKQPVELAPMEGAQQQPFDYEGSVAQPGPENPTVVTILGGQEVDGGISGAPLVDTATKAVVGIVQYRRETAGGLSGGAAIPIDVAMERLPLVRACHDQPPIASRQWRELIGDERPEIDTIELTVSGSLTAWQVVYGGTSRSMTVVDFAADTAEAVFGWVPQRRPHDKREVQLSGGLLARALFPGPIADEVRLAAGSKAPVRIRLCIADGFDRLWEVPWEYATVPDTSAFLAMEEPFELARCVMNHQVERRTVPMKATVLPVVPRFTGGASLPDSDEQWSAIEADHFGDVLKELRSIEPTATTAYTLTDVSNWEGGQVDVLHFIGFGRQRDGYGTLLLNDESQGQDWVDVQTFCESVAAVAPRLAICQLTLPPPGMVWRPPRPDWCRPALTGEVAAVVYTQFPVHPARLKRFNNALYGSLAAGRPIEVAVRVGRRALRAYPQDPAAFGSIVLLTGRNGGEQLVQAPTGELKASAVPSPAEESEQDQSQKPARR